MKTYLVLEKSFGRVSSLVGTISHRYVKKVIPNSDDVSSHVLLLFSNGEAWESHAHTGGFFPVTLKELQSVKKEIVWHIKLPLTEPESALWREDCRLAWGKHDYDMRLIARIGLNAAFRIPIPRTPGKWDCSEAVTRLLLPYRVNLMEKTKEWTKSKTHPDRVQPGMIQAAYLLEECLEDGYPEI